VTFALFAVIPGRKGVGTRRRARTPDADGPEARPTRRAVQL
jgi:hypothetical protein